MSFEAVVLPGYQARLVEIHAGVAQLRSGQMLAFAIMCAAIAAILFLGFLALTRRSIRCCPIRSRPLPVLVYSGRKLRRRKSALLKSVRLERFYERGIARLEGRWAGTGASGEEFRRAEHPYEQDLHLFGEGSLFELLCTCRTEIGRRCLANYLLDAPDPRRGQRAPGGSSGTAQPNRSCVSESVYSANSILRNPGGRLSSNGWDRREFPFTPHFVLAAFATSVVLGVTSAIGIRFCVSRGPI